ncbi:MAG TPA: hypothetical protein VLI06_07205 [Solimonas sp.]|nr:hypothetical protein [Solimonas sp.]
MPHLASLRVYHNSADADPKQGGTPTPALLLHMIGGKVVRHTALDQIPDWAKPLLAIAFKCGGD